MKVFHSLVFKTTGPRISKTTKTSGGMKGGTADSLPAEFVNQRTRTDRLVPVWSPIRDWCVELIPKRSSKGVIQWRSVARARAEIGHFTRIALSPSGYVLQTI